MFDLLDEALEADELQAYLDDAEGFCLGEKKLSPHEFTRINRELSIQAVSRIGKRRFVRDSDGHHLIWTGSDKTEHDLGLVHDPNVMREYPGFSKSATRSLGQDDVKRHELVKVPGRRKNATRVELKCGTSGVGLNFRLALRNAALKKSLQNSLKQEFSKNNGFDFWNRFSGRA